MRVLHGALAAAALALSGGALALPGGQSTTYRGRL